MKKKPEYEAIILTGSNLGKPLDNLVFARESLQELPGKLCEISAVYRSEPWGYTSQNPFYNQVVQFFTSLQPARLLAFLLDIEKHAGRFRSKEGYEDRVLDMDLLFFDDRIIQTDTLMIPHPRLHLRRFTLLPLVEIRPDFFHPVLQKTAVELLKGCPDKSEVERIS